MGETRDEKLAEIDGLPENSLKTNFLLIEHCK